jgi:hypothetical protein
MNHKWKVITGFAVIIMGCTRETSGMEAIPLKTEHKVQNKFSFFPNQPFDLATSRFWQLITQRGWNNIRNDELVSILELAQYAATGIRTLSRETKRSRINLLKFAEQHYSDLERFLKQIQIEVQAEADGTHPVEQ